MCLLILIAGICKRPNEAIVLNLHHYGHDERDAVKIYACTIWSSSKLNYVNFSNVLTICFRNRSSKLTDRTYKNEKNPFLMFCSKFNNKLTWCERWYPNWFTHILINNSIFTQKPSVSMFTISAGHIVECV